MRNLFAGLTLAALAGLCAHPALAEEWRWFPVKGGAVAFDADSLKTDIATGAAAANTVIFYDPPRPAGAARYSFVAERLEFECRSDRHRWSQSAILDAGGAIITTRDDGDWTKIGTEKGSTGLFKQMLCLAQTPPGGRQAKDLATLIVALRASAPTTAAATKPATVPTPPPPAAPPSKPPAAQAPPKPPQKATTPTAKPAPLDLDALVANLNAVSEANAKGVTAPPPVPAPVTQPSVTQPSVTKPPAPKTPAAKTKAPPPTPAKPTLKLRPLTIP